MINIYYYKSKEGNFGDDLNIALWNHVFADRDLTFCFHGDEYSTENELLDRMIIGIGTLLDSRLPKSPQKIIFGTGAGYFSPPVLDESYTVLFVRGPKTAQTLGLEPSMAITDPALLACDFIEPTDTVAGRIGLLPHHGSLYTNMWQDLADTHGLHFINPRHDARHVIANISSCQALITEAMHGAILADAYRTPWVPVSSNPGINATKWMDWCATVNLPYEPYDLKLTYEDGGSFNSTRIKNALKMPLNNRVMKRILKDKRFQLSDDALRQDLLEKLRAQVDRLRSLYVEERNDQ